MGQINFLDLKIKRDKHVFIWSVHHKDPWMGQYTTFGSFCPSQYKIGLVKISFSKAYRLCS